MFCCLKRNHRLGYLKQALFFNMGNRGISPELVLQWLTVFTEAMTIYEQENMPYIKKKNNKKKIFWESVGEKNKKKTCSVLFVGSHPPSPPPTPECSLINFALFGIFFRGGSFLNLCFLSNLQIDIESMRQCWELLGLFVR